MKKFMDLVAEAREQVEELFPWDVDELIKKDDGALVLDIREECEFSAYHIEHTMLVPRGILETACEEEYEDSVPELIESRDREIVVICRSGNRSLLAAQTMKTMGYNNVKSMQTGLRGWNDYELPLKNAQQEIVDPDDADEMLNAGFCSTFMHPNRRTILS
ncbi:MAG: rhodanese-like domain-containing protein [Gammaproteobacteria bacterium]|nr:rhodanese-like domain-containing protein [Gammaproteobacteria bacterium]